MTPGVPPTHTPRRASNWHALYLLAVSAMTGLAGFLFPAARAGAIEASFPGWGQSAWYGGLLLGAVMGICGITLAGSRGRPGGSEDDLQRNLGRIVTGLTLERAGMLILTGICGGYLLGAIAYVGLDRVATALGATFVAAFALANAARARQIRLTLTAARSAVEPDRGETT